MKYGNGNRILSEWEDNVLFDADDPDFNNSNAIHGSNVLQPPTVTAVRSLGTFINKVPSAMSLASVQGPHLSDLYTPLGSSISVSSSLSDLVGSPLEVSMDNVLTIEELRAQLGSCFTCGVSWTDDHVSLDCSECGGYSMERPCPLCDGKCGVQWKRDFTMSHACGKARWQGVCPSFPDAVHIHPSEAANPMTVPPASCAAASQFLAQELCARLEQLSASAQT
ncbi:protein pinocchio isoform X2 [Hermetia illucens]|uniref:protein pinocchio isoform X2 n=1 Tax=Hermetia illucens TaxID=343691 RepID=UPI0018CC2CDF|nr:protein pinocchio isoform X2 [Hermetia illucens]